MWASRYRADVEWSLRGRCKLHDAVRGEWRASEVSPLRPCGTFSGDESEEVLGRNRVLQTSYRLYVEP
jgi:hypothetical protein